MNLNAVLLAVGPLSLLLVALIVFVENGLLFPFLPGDSLMFAAAILAAPLHVPWLLVVAVAAAAAILGGELGFMIGRRFGRRWFRPDARILKTRYLDETDAFFLRWGSWAVLMARFVPIVRTYLAPAAGASDFGHRRFTVWNSIGALVWAGLLGTAGYFLGSIPWVASNIEWISVGIVVVTVGPVLIAALARRRTERTESADSL